MSEETEIVRKPDDSHILNVSVRAWLSLVIVGTVCAISLLQAIHAYRGGADNLIEEPLYSMVVLTLGFYFGQKTQAK